MPTLLRGGIANTTDQARPVTLKPLMACLPGRPVWPPKSSLLQDNEFQCTSSTSCEIPTAFCRRLAQANSQVDAAVADCNHNGLVTWIKTWLASIHLRDDGGSASTAVVHPFEAMTKSTLLR